MADFYHIKILGGFIYFYILFIKEREAEKERAPICGSPLQMPQWLGWAVLRLGSRSRSRSPVWAQGTYALAPSPAAAQDVCCQEQGSGWNLVTLMQDLTKCPPRAYLLVHNLCNAGDSYLLSLNAWSGGGGTNQPCRFAFWSHVQRPVKIDALLKKLFF